MAEINEFVSFDFIIFFFEDLWKQVFLKGILFKSLEILFNY